MSGSGLPSSSRLGLRRRFIGFAVVKRRSKGCNVGLPSQYYRNLTSYRGHAHNCINACVQQWHGALCFLHNNASLLQYFLLYHSGRRQSEVFSGTYTLRRSVTIDLSLYVYVRNGGTFVYYLSACCDLGEWSTVLHSIFLSCGGRSWIISGRNHPSNSDSNNNNNKL